MDGGWNGCNPRPAGPARVFAISIRCCRACAIRASSRHRCRNFCAAANGAFLTGRCPPRSAPGLSKPPGSGLRATWLGHSTVLIEIDGYRVLTDPVWGTRASPSRLAGPKRFQPVPVELRSLPDIDVVVISHDYYDHLDYPTILQLVET